MAPGYNLTKIIEPVKEGAVRWIVMAYDGVLELASLLKLRV
jgi:hypothetical protein